MMLTCGPARGEGPPSDDQKAAARILGTEGVRMAMAGDCAGAVDKLTRAEALVHAPTTAMPLARCEIQLGKLVAGTERLNRLVREPLPSGAPQSWIDAQKQGQALLDATEPKIARLRIHVERAPGVLPDAPVLVAVDGEAVPQVLLDNDRPTDPGAHRVTLSGAGLKATDAEVTVATGQSQSVALRAEPDLTAATPLPVTGPVGEPAPPASAMHPSSGPNRTATYVSLGVGGVGLVVGTVFGVLALSTKSNLDKACNSNKICPASSQGDIDALHTDSIVSTIGFGVGVAGAALGAVFFFTANGERAAEGGPGKSALDLKPWVGPGSAGVAGSF